jgi:hypothetical protein
MAWGQWCTALQIPQNTLFPLYIEVIYARSYGEGDTSALRLLEQAQNEVVHGIKVCDFIATVSPTHMHCTIAEEIIHKSQLVSPH